MDTIFRQESSLDAIRQRNHFQQVTKGLSEDERIVYATVQRLVSTIDHMEQFDRRVQLTTNMLKDKDYKGLEQIYPKGKKDKRIAADKRRASKRLSTVPSDSFSPPSSPTTSSGSSSPPSEASPSVKRTPAVNGSAIRSSRRKYGKVK
ncbi:unnamed protein product [Auanema sp. JU1783]|nr:unnamed protein product [Auanema sp. JU1783]